MAVLSKNVEHLTQRVDEGFTRVDKSFDRIDKNFDRIDRSLDRLQTTVQWQMWMLVGVVVLGFVSGVIKLVFFPTLKPQRPAQVLPRLHAQSVAGAMSGCGWQR